MRLAKLRTGILAGCIGAFGGLGSLWLSAHKEPFFLNPQAPGVLLYADTRNPGAPGAVTFNNPASLDCFQIYTQVDDASAQYSLRLDGPNRMLATCTSRGNASFGFGHDIAPGTYTLTADRVAGLQVYVADRRLGMDGWQILLRLYLLLVALVAAFALWTQRPAASARSRLIARAILLRIGTAVALIFAYLLLHEGGHGGVAFLFGKFDASHSDFFGLHGTPHSGLKWGVNIAPWQRAAISFAGPVTPMITGWLIFMWWRSAHGRRLRAVHVVIDFVVTSLLALVTFGCVVLPAYSLGLVQDGDWSNYAQNVPGGAAAAHAVAWAIFGVTAAIFVKVAPHAFWCWRYAGYLGKKEAPVDVD